MARRELIYDIERYCPFNEQEEKDKALILNWIKTNDNAFSRENAVAHMTASAWVVNKDRSKVLMVYHNIYHSWSWLGGHADGETDLLAVAIREVKEEAEIRHVQPVSKEIFSLESLTVDGHMKRGCYVSSHLHLNVTYLVYAGRSTGKIHRAVVRGACVRKAAGKDENDLEVSQDSTIKRCKKEQPD